MLGETMYNVTYNIIITIHVSVYIILSAPHPTCY